MAADNMKKIKILLIGGGAREHALAWKLSQSPRTAWVHIAPGNPGLEFTTTLVKKEIDDLEGLAEYALKEGIELVLIGPEAPLAMGFADYMGQKGLKVFGPKAEAAKLESSKSFAKAFMARHNIPTAAYESFIDFDKALKYLDEKPDAPIVVKASGLAQGKGVTVAQNREEAKNAVREAMADGRFGDAGSEVIIEDYIDGEELSILSFTDGKSISLMPPVQDHKRLGEGDTGPNTGGMGAYSPVAIYTPEVAREIEEKIIKPTLNGLIKDNIDYCGCIYFGIILPSANSSYKGPQVIEYNARFGDPETEVLMPLLQSDLTEIILACAEGRLSECEIKWSDKTAVCVVMASDGYPGEYKSGHVITESVPVMGGTALSFHAGTALNERFETVSAGGRVLTVVATGEDLEEALDVVYERIRSIHFKGNYYRRDIAHRELARRKKLKNS